ncbi:Hpt domain-containing protein [Arthrobacter sp. Soil762]|uniref:Hpt domain-containing protein n=1 Tax=Arthrobacter sp. Soil762 TaxID=1736401 RepID=UPI0006F7F8A2|nr:Hpt domain-containing protein [Arthrobacter sp. Soil762]KRE74441.1 histidine kinase [Arthrobacter sp. Soil762]
MAPDEGNALPLLDQAVLDRLRTELDDDEGVWIVFVRNFIDYLPQRTEKLRLTLTTGDLAGALDAVLSLKTASQMVGAERLAELAMDLERSLRHETLDSEPARVLPRLAADHLTQIKRCARQTSYLLQKYLHSG